MQIIYISCVVLAQYPSYYRFWFAPVGQESLGSQFENNHVKSRWVTTAKRALRVNIKTELMYKKREVGKC